MLYPWPNFSVLSLALAKKALEAVGLGIQAVGRDHLWVEILG